MESGKRNKRRIGLISAVIVIIVCVGLIIGGMKLTMFHSAKLDEEILDQVVINSPNVSLGSRIKAQNDIFKGQFIYKQYKDIDGYIIPWTDIIGNYGVWGENSVGRVPLNNFNGTLDFTEGTNQKMMKFYSQDVPYKKINNDIVLTSTDTDKVMEMAISFDKKYSLKEIRAKIPVNLNIAWLWLGEEENGGQSDALTPDQVYGFEGIQKKVEKVSDADVFKGNYNNFISSLESLASKSEHVANLLTKYGKEDIDSLQFKGIVLTGQAINFKQLAGAPFIRASEIGATADIVPYIKPYK
ncbi:anti sigma factor C-terminal domain-containing protein [Listeria grandensis]|uniref:anti sigma factor C-terminal domain-containing protein n=1 Tax=Listeria grandensis TaxID=1494963 RepID=UPI00164D7CB3|nr:anti sigma factor C-terminal domain-containing protein [Listeria grandensis]MBC6315995.1 hypothetical protein [Listeria grandensis]